MVFPNRVGVHVPVHVLRLSVRLQLYYFPQTGPQMYADIEPSPIIYLRCVGEVLLIGRTGTDCCPYSASVRNSGVQLYIVLYIGLFMCVGGAVVEQE